MLPLSTVAAVGVGLVQFMFNSCYNKKNSRCRPSGYFSSNVNEYDGNLKT